MVIRGTFTNNNKGVVYLEQADVDRNILIDSAVIRNGHVRFTLNQNGPEFYQLGLGNNDFISLLAMPGESINLTFGDSPLITSYTVDGSSESEKVRDLDIKLYKTKVSLDSLSGLFNALNESDQAIRGAELEKQYVDIIVKQRRYNISFILENMNSMSSLKALYQRLDDNTYVLYQPRDVQFLKIVSDSLSVKYPTSKHVLGLAENLKKELSRLNIDRLTQIASQKTAEVLDPDLLNTEGKRVKLSSLKGKYVLLCFWATTSETSMANLSELKNIYKTYHSKGLEIYQVNLDQNEERWKNAVKFEELPWISVREDDPLNPRYAKILNVNQLPFNVLFDPQGEIVNINLFSRNLQIKMDQLFNK